MLAWLLVLSGVAASTEAAQQPPVPTFPARAERVVVDVVVTDRDGVPVTGLSAPDFEVSEDGRPQRIVSFEAIAPGASAASRAGEAATTLPAGRELQPLPERFYAVVFDDLNLSPLKVNQARAATAAFLRSLEAGDRVLLVSTSTGQGGLSTSESGRQDLLGMLPGLKAGNHPDLAPDHLTDYEAMAIHVLHDPGVRARVEERVVTRARLFSEMRGNLNIEGMAAEAYNRSAARIQATLRALQQLLRGIAAEKGRKSVVLVSEGFIQDPRMEEFRGIAQAAMRANAVLYFVDARRLDLGSAEYPAELNDLGSARDLGLTLAEEASAVVGSETLARDTGGFSITSTNDLAGGMRRIADESRAYYLVGYDPTKESDGKFRKIHVKVNRKGVRVRARKGYYAEGRPAAAPPGE